MMSESLVIHKLLVSETELPHLIAASSASIRLANDAAASSLQDTSSTELPLLPFGSDEAQGVRFAQARRKEKEYSVAY